MEKIDKILRASLAKKGLGAAARSAEICFIATKWGNGRFSAISFSRGILKVSVKSSPAASELEIEKEKLIDFLNQKLGRESVRSVRIVVGQGRRD